MSLGELHQKLGDGFSESTIRRKIKNGQYREGVHWYNAAPVGSKKRVYRFNYDEIVRELTNHRKARKSK